MAAGSDTPPAVLIEPYRDSDSHDIERLELDCARPISGEFPFKYVKVARLYRAGYHARTLVFPATFTLTARMSVSTPVIGLISGALKSAYYDNHPTTVGYLFDLRVHDNYLRQGVGQLLVKRCEERLQDMGAKLLYGILYAANVKAEMMFGGNLGYKIATKKVVHVEGLAGVKPGEFSLQEVESLQAQKNMQEFYREKDMTLLSFQELLSAKECLGTYCVTDGDGNRAEASVWDATAHTSKAVVEVYFPRGQILVPSFYLPFFLCAICLFVFGFLAAVAAYELIPMQVLKLLFASIMLLVGIFALEFVVVFFKYWRVCVNSPAGERKLHLFGLHYAGNSDIKEVLYEELLQGLKLRFQSRAELLSWAVDETDPDRHCFSSQMHELVYYQRKVGETVWNAWTRSLFYDPRDLV